MAPKTYLVNELNNFQIFDDDLKNIWGNLYKSLEIIELGSKPKQFISINQELLFHGEKFKGKIVFL